MVPRRVTLGLERAFFFFFPQGCLGFSSGAVIVHHQHRQEHVESCRFRDPPLSYLGVVLRAWSERSFGGNSFPVTHKDFATLMVEKERDSTGKGERRPLNRNLL